MIYSLENLVTRAVILVPAVNFKTGEFDQNEILFYVRPGCSNVGKYETTLPGGGVEEADFKGLVDLSDETKVITAGLLGIVRELNEEFNLHLKKEIFKFVGIYTNDEEWTTILFVTELETKPSVVTKSDTGGTLWKSENDTRMGKVKLFADHLHQTLEALNKLNENLSE